MGFLESALELAAKGFHVFPVTEGQKKPPRISDFPELASRDPQQIKEWWGTWPDANIGISTTRFGDNEALVVVDVDVKEGKNGEESVLKWELAGKELPRTFTQQTPSNGTHYVYRSKTPTAGSIEKVAKGIDIRSQSNYILGAGSRIEKGTYSCSDEEVRQAPEWLIQACGEVKEKDANQPKEIEGVDKKAATLRAIEYLKHDAPIAVKGQGGDQTTFRVACHVKDFGVDEASCVDLMFEHWNPKCPPGWSYDKLQTKVENAYRYGKEPVGVAAPEADFSPVEQSNEDEDKDEEHPDEGGQDEIHLGKLNQEYALVYIGGSHFILHETIDEKGRKIHTLLSEQTFKRKFSPYYFIDGEKPVTYAQKWLNWKMRREYAGLCFAPEREPRHNYYNLWHGFAVKPTSYNEASKAAKLGFDAFMEHLHTNVCQSNTELSEWLTGYFAHMIQKPFERPLTTVVFRGTKGVGKNALIDRVGHLLGSGHYLVAHDGRYLTSNFNGHLDSCLCLVLDEAFWSGDKAAEGKLKGLTTAPEILIERKGKEPYKVDNLVRLIVVGNEDWLVPASHDERRYAVFQVGEGRKQDLKFFEDMRINMDEKGGAEVLLHFLKNVDLSKTDVNKAPKTEALLDQKLSSLDRFYTFWLECLQEGRIVHSDFSESWQETLDKDRFRRAFMTYCKSHNMSGWGHTAEKIGKLLKACLPSVVTNHKRRESNGFVYVYKIPSLEVARAEWDVFIGHKNKWY